jgi:HEAT repeat protein
MRERLGRWLGVKPGEGRRVVLSGLYVACVAGAFLLAKPVRNALFLEQYGPYRLVYVYVGVPLVLSVWLPGHRLLAARLGPRRAIVATLVGFACAAAAFWGGFRLRPTGWLPALFYVWVNAFGVVALVQAWGLIGTLFDTRQAKRLFGLIGAGASLGAVAGGVMATTLVRPLGGSVNLLLVLAGLLALAAVCVTQLQREGSAGTLATPERWSARETLREAARTPYLRRIAAMVFVATVMTQWVGFQLSLVAAERFGADADRLTTFFGRFNVALGLAALATQLVVTSRLLRRYGIGPALLVLPIALGTGALAVLLVPGFWSVVFLAALDQGLRFSVDKAGYELLYLPLGAARRSPIRAAVDIVGNRLADAAGGVALGVMMQPWALGREPAHVLTGTAAASLALVGVWLLLATRLRRDYLETIRQGIHRHRLEAEGPLRRPPALGGAGRAEAVAQLSSTVPEVLAGALDLLARDPVIPVPPALYRLVDHASPGVRRRAIACLAAADDRVGLPRVEARLEDPDAEVRAAALVYLARTQGVDPLEAIDKMGSAGEAAAVDPWACQAAIVAFLARPGPTENREAARTLVATMIARSASAAVSALGALGDTVVPIARDLLRDTASPSDVRREIPRVLAAVGSAAAQAVLLDGLLEGDPMLRSRIVAALNKVGDRRPDLRADPAAIETLLLAEILGHYRSYQVLGALGTLPPDAPVVTALSHAMERELERMFRLLGLLARQDDFHSAYLGVRSHDPGIRANAAEWLEHALPPAFGRLLLPLVDPTVGRAERIALANRLLGVPVSSVEQALATLLAGEDSWLKVCAAYAAGALELDELRAELVRWADDPEPQVREAVRAALRRLAFASAVTDQSGAAAVDAHAYAGAAALGVG